ncbi:MAG: hypothetical protein FWD53_12795, partial [Phycisphaerales bacterium]|nr:hypothetical protein [Phycisphaerales bacterium]
AQTKEYWTRVNYNVMVPPGKSTVTMPTDMYVGEKSRPGRPLLKERVTFLAFGPEKYPLVFDNIRLEKNEVVTFDGLKAFDFGPAEQQVMAGYTGVDVARYTKERGYGWDVRGYQRGFDGRQPDSLFGDFVITADNAAFQVDLPNGKYQVVMNIDCPGGFWGEVQHFTYRQVLANGKAVVDEKQTLEEHKKKYFQNARVEDLPGVDPFTQYVEKMFNVRRFDVDVTDGKLVLEMRGDGLWPIALSTLVIYPAAKSEDGKKFWDWTTKQRRDQFENYFKQVNPPPTGAKAPATGYRVFSRHFMTPPNAFDGPLPGEEVMKEGLLRAMVAKGEEAAVCFSVQPGEDIGEIDVQVNDVELRSRSDGMMRRLRLPVQAGWLDYRISRVTMDGTVYEVKPRYWHPAPAPAAKGVTRTFWLRMKVPGDWPEGIYAGTIVVKPAKGAETRIPLTVTVLPFAIDQITDVSAGPWGCTIGLPWQNDAAKKQWNEQMLEKSLRAVRESGSTTVTGLPHIGMTASGGKVELDFSQADKEMKLLRSLGFTQMINSYGLGLAYPMYGATGVGGGPDEEFAKKAGFTNMEAFLRALYGGIEEHAAKNDWLPVAWNICDEPVNADIAAAAKNAVLHQKVADDLKLKYSIFTGATSMVGDKPSDPHYLLVRALGMPSLNIHDDAVVKMIQQDGHRFSFYNGGNRWTFGRYMKALVVHYGLAHRPTWHFNIVAGDPYYALDCREDDYCWYNTDERQTMVPSLSLLAQIQPGLNDYRYLTTLHRLAKEKGDAGGGAAMKVFEKHVALVAGKDRPAPKPEAFDKDRKEVVDAILSVIGQK